MRLRGDPGVVFRAFAAVGLPLAAVGALRAETPAVATLMSGRAESDSLGLVPRPRRVEDLGGTLELTPETGIRVVDPDARGVAELLAHRLRASTGFAFPVGEGEDGLRLLLDAGLEDTLGREGYRLACGERDATLTAAAPAGLFYACQTLLQLFPPAIDAAEPVADVAWRAPRVSIEDWPRFEWRGLMLDSARHFFPVEFVKRYVDLLARHKMNRFHWHLTEDQGWRIEVRAHPRLTEVGARRAQTPIPSDRARGDGRPYAGHYTQEEIRDVVAYARERFVTVVPEIEMPGHSLAALAVYPELSCTGGPFEVGTRWGVYEDVYCAGKEETFAFLESVLDEVAELFPGPFVHVGGDECPKSRWEDCADCQARIEAEGLADEHELQAYFIERIERHVNARGKRLIGWDEILEGHLAPNATVMSWRGVAGGLAAARLGHDVVMSPNSHCYFDYYQARDTESEPPAIGGHLPLERVYAFDPTAELDEEAAGHVLGAQGNLWTEYVPDAGQAEYMVYPRAVALAERAWSAADARDFEEFRRRLARHLERLERLGVNYRPLDSSD